ncbi:MAG: hypothetical protein ACE5K0_10715 [Candidatus Methanofastidiosia archaeon]
MQKVIALNSGGIDSPVASFIVSKRFEVIAHYCNNYPFSDDVTMKRVLDTIKKLSEILKKPIKTYITPHGQNTVEFLKVCGKRGRKFTCIFCRRMMFRVAFKIALKEGAVALVSGENLGQVASQTLQNIYVTEKALKMPILRPLIGLDKIDIERWGKDISTYEISVRRAICCSVTPKYPSINTQLKKFEEIEERLDIEDLVEKSFEKREIFFLEEKKNRD